MIQCKCISCNTFSRCECASKSATNSNRFKLWTLILLFYEKKTTTIICWSNKIWWEYNRDKNTIVPSRESDFLMMMIWYDKLLLRLFDNTFSTRYSTFGALSKEKRGTTNAIIKWLSFFIISSQANLLLLRNSIHSRLNEANLQKLPVHLNQCSLWIGTFNVSIYKSIWVWKTFIPFE